MPLDQMTHSFEINLGTTEGERNTLTGFVEFNTDGKVSFEFDEISKPVTPETMNHFNELMNLMKKFHDQHKGIIKVEVKKLP